MQNLYQLVKVSLINSRNRVHVRSDVTLHVNMTPLTVVDRLLKERLCKLKKAGLLKKIICEFPARQWKWHMLFDLSMLMNN